MWIVQAYNSNVNRKFQLGLVFPIDSWEIYLIHHTKFLELKKSKFYSKNFPGISQKEHIRLYMSIKLMMGNLSGLDKNSHYRHQNKNLVTFFLEICRDTYWIQLMMTTIIIVLSGKVSFIQKITLNRSCKKVYATF